MNNKKTGPIFSLVPRDLGSTYVVIRTSRRRTFVRTLVRQNSCSSKTLLSCFEFHRIRDDDFRCRDLARALPARSPEAIIAEFAQHSVSLGEGPFFSPGGVIAPGLARPLTPPNSSPEAPGAAP